MPNRAYPHVRHSACVYSYRPMCVCLRERAHIGVYIIMSLYMSVYLALGQFIDDFAVTLTHSHTHTHTHTNTQREKILCIDC